MSGKPTLNRGSQYPSDVYSLDDSTLVNRTSESNVASTDVANIKPLSY